MDLVFRNTIPNVFARLRRHLGFFYLGSRALGTRQQSRSPVSMRNTETKIMRQPIIEKLIAEFLKLHIFYLRLFVRIFIVH